MIPGKNQNNIGIFLLNGIDVLENSIGCAFIPVLTKPALGRQRNNIFIAFW
jgi:hypothetical protein